MILSIVTGTYNRLDFLRAMIDSARSQLPPSIAYEFVVVDGGSKDGTQAWCKAQSDVRLIEQGGYLGIFVLMVVENIFPPIPSELIMGMGGVAVSLTPKEFDLLDYLAREPGTVFRRADILRDVWQTTWYGTTKTLDAHVASIRKKLGNAEWIESVRGVGFTLRVVA